MNENTPSEEIREQIAKAAMLIAAGCHPSRVAFNLGVPRATVKQYRADYPKLWQKSLRDAKGRLNPKERERAPERKATTRHGELNRAPMTEQVERAIILATRMIAAGRTMAEVCRELDRSAVTIAEYATRHRTFWKACMDKAGEHYAEAVRRVAGTDAILDDPTNYWATACAAEKWASKAGQELFPANGEQTLCTFYRDYYEPVVMEHDAGQSYRKLMEISLKRWRLITGDPPLEQISTDMLSRFRSFLLKCRSMGRGECLSPVTAANYLTNVQRLLAKAGQPGPRNRDAAGILDRVPWVRLPRIRQQIPKIVNEETVGRLYDAAGIMAVHHLPGVEPADWWRALLVVVWSTAARRRTLLELQWSDYQPEQSRLVVPGVRIKSGRPHIYPLTKAAVEHLDRIRTDRALIFQWPTHIRQFHIAWNQLQWEAGIPRADKFGLHTLRRSAITNLAHHSLAAAQLLAGHRSVDITCQRYIDANPVVTKAVENMPEPEAFRRKTA